MAISNEVLIIFIKNPERGKVKTRLAATVGEDKALAIYKSLMAHTREAALGVTAKRLLFYSENIAPADDWSTTSFIKRLQSNGDLGERMKEAFKVGFQQGSKVMIIGSDCPQLTTALIQQAYSALDQHDFVLGPALDGGYYLLGMSSFTPSLFESMPWSTDQVAAITRDRIAAIGSLYELPSLSDIDYEEDWKKYGWEV